MTATAQSGTAPRRKGRRSFDATGMPFAIVVGLLVVGAAVFGWTPAGTRAIAVFVDLALRGGTVVAVGAMIAAAVATYRPPPAPAQGPLALGTAWMAAALASLRAPSPFPFDLARADAVAQAGNGGAAVAARFAFAGVLSPVTLVAALLAIGPHVALGGVVVGAVLAAAVTAWATAPAFAAVSAGTPSWPGRYVVVGMVVGDPDEFVPRAALTIELGLRRLVAGAALVAVVVGAPTDAMVIAAAAIPPLAVVLAVAVAFIASVGPEAAPFLVVAFAPFGPGAMVAAGVVATLADLRRTRLLAQRYGTGVAWRFATVAVVVAVAAGCWTAVFT